MAKSVNVQVVADVTQYERALRRAAQDTRQFDRAVSRTTSDARGGSQVFRSLGRSIAFASGGYLAFGGATDLLRSTLDAAGAAETAQKQLAAQLAAVGIQFETVQGQIDRTTTSLSHLAGFTSDDLTGSLTTLVRATGDVNTALQLNAVAADVARGRGISLISAATTLGKAYNGQTGALKRLGITLPPTVKGMDALAEVAKRYAGQAQAGKSATDDFNVSLNDLQVEAGKGLIPILDGVLKGLTDVVGGIEQVNSKLRSSGLGFLTHGLKDIKGPSLLNLFGIGGGGQKAPGPPVAVLPPIGARGPTLGGGKLKAVPKGITADQRNQWFDAMIGQQLARVQDVDSLKQQNARLQVIAAEIQKRLAATKDITRKLTLEGQLLDIQNNIRQNNQQIDADAAQAAKEAAQAAKDRAEAAQAAAQAARDEALAWKDLAVERAGATTSLQDDLKAAQARLALVTQQVQIGKMTAAKALELWQAQQAVIAITNQIADAAKQQRVKALDRKIDWAEFNLEKAGATKTLKDDIAAQKAIIARIREHIRLVGRTIDDARSLFQAQQNLKDLLGQRKKNQPKPDNWAFGVWQRIVGRNGGITGGGVPPLTMPTLSGARPFGGAGVTIQNLNLHGVQDVRGLSDELVKAASTRPQPRRGP